MLLARCANRATEGRPYGLQIQNSFGGLVENLVNRVGSERLLFGTDMPWFDEYQAVGGVLSADISENDMRNILYRNAERIFGTEW